MRAPGFVWRLQTEDGNATAVQAFEWDRTGSAGVLVNMSVWESVETLAGYVYCDTHRQVLKRRGQWFERMAEAYAALWWMPAGYTPTTAEAEERVLRLREFGPTPYAFTLREHFPPPDVPNPRPTRSPEDWTCPPEAATVILIMDQMYTRPWPRNAPSTVRTTCGGWPNCRAAGRLSMAKLRSPGRTRPTPSCRIRAVP